MKMRCVDRASSEIAQWLSLNLMDLIVAVTHRRFHGRMEISMCKKRFKKENKEARDILHEVLQDDFVRQLPCVRNVQMAAYRVLESCLDAALTSGISPIYIKCDRHIPKLTFPDGLEKGSLTAPPEGSESGKGNSTGTPKEGSESGDENPSRAVVNPELDGPIEVKTCLHDVRQYWMIINQAAFYDQQKGSFVKDLKRLELKWKGKTTIKREKLAMFAGGASSVSPYLEGTASEVKGYYGDLSDSQPHFRMPLKIMMKQIIPLASQSEAVRSVVCVMEEGNESSGTESHAHRPVVENDRCYSFWNSLYLFHITGRTGKEKGVAVNTVTGVVHNADFRYKHPRFECVLTPVTKGRWNKFVLDGNKDIRWDSFKGLTRSMWLTVKS